VPRKRSVSPPRSSNRTCGFPASGFPTGFVAGIRRAADTSVIHIPASPWRRDTACSEGSWSRAVLHRLAPSHRPSPSSTSAPEVRALPSTGVTRLQQYYDPVRHPPVPPPVSAVEAATLAQGGSPPITRITLPACRAHYPGGSRRVRLSIASPLARPSPLSRRVGIRTSTFEACSGFTHVTARWIAQPPKAAFVTRLRSSRLPDQTARQLPEQSTTLWVEPSSTGDPRLRGALDMTKTGRHDHAAI